MSYLTQFRLKAWEKAYWFFAGQGYQDSECEFYAKKFEQHAVEEMSGLDSDYTLDDLLNTFVSDIMYAEKAEDDKERSQHV
jgi:hypothetical protein